MPITISRKKFSYVAEWAEAYEVTDQTVLNWINADDEFPAMQVGDPGGRGVWIIEHVLGKQYMREVKGRIPLQRF
jgi:hypothetical protein